MMEISAALLDYKAKCFGERLLHVSLLPIRDARNINILQKKNNNNNLLFNIRLNLPLCFKQNETGTIGVAALLFFNSF